MGSRLMLVAMMSALPAFPLPALGAEEDDKPAERVTGLEITEQQQVAEALKAVEDAWADLESATADRWRSAKETFDQAVIDLEQTWQEVTEEGPPPLTGPTSRGSD